jgi:hypothetical protein
MLFRNIEVLDKNYIAVFIKVFTKSGLRMFDWIQLAQDRDQWCSPLSFHKTWMNFLGS